MGVSGLFLLIESVRLKKKAKYVEFMKKKYASLIATELTLGANLDED